MRGKSFYENASHSANSSVVKAFFNDLAEEEKDHMDFLKIQLKHVNKDSKLDLDSMKNYKQENLIITKELKMNLILFNYLIYHLNIFRITSIATSFYF